MPVRLDYTEEKTRKMTFSTGQRLAIGGMFLATAVCVVGLGAPYWLMADLAEFGVTSDVLNAHMSPFMYCAKIGDSQECDTIPFNIDDVDGTSAWFLAVRLCGMVCVFLGALCALVTLILCCCGRGSTLALGIICFIAAGIGAAAAAIFATKYKDDNFWTSSAMNLKLMEFGWAFFLYCGGCGLLGLVSILACICKPADEYRPVAVV
nr:hypothetical protein BaRGS_027682 [Batillaria attramentaria]